MPYTPTTWIDEVPAASPIKYKITDDTGGITNASAKIELVTSVTPGTPLNAVNLNKIEAALVADRASIEGMLLNVYPIGSVYTSIISTNPASLFGGTWSAFGAGKVLVGLDAGQTEFDTAEETGGEKNHALTTAELASHSHVERYTDPGSGYDGNFYEYITTPVGSYGSYRAMTSVIGVLMNHLNVLPTKLTTASTGSGTAHNNLQPYIVVYFFKRTA